jgi:large subunit ribosomal protein L10
VADLKDRFQRAKGIVLTDYKGITVTEMVELRETLRKSDLEYRVVKNTLAGIATKGTHAEPLGDRFTGPVGVAISYDDPAKLTKQVLEYSKKNKKLKITCGLVENTLYDNEQLKAIAALPPRDVLLATLAGTMQAPAGKLAQLLNATVCRFAFALNALKEKKGEA